MLFGQVTLESPRNHVSDPRSPKGKWQFLGLSRRLKSTVSHCCGVHSKKINYNISATDVSNCIAPNQLVSH